MNGFILTRIATCLNLGRILENDLALEVCLLKLTECNFFVDEAHARHDQW